jgi:hypothetical protein
MKKIKIFAVTFLLTTFIASTEKERRIAGKEKGNHSSLKMFSRSLPDGDKITWYVSVPTGTTTEIDNSSLTLKMPDGVAIYGLHKQTNQFEKFAAAGYNCTCESKDGKCTPFVAGNQVGCVTNQEGPCSKCVGTKNNSLELFSDYSKVYYVHETEADDMGSLGGLSDITPISSPERIENLSPVTEKILSDPAITNALNAIRENYSYNSEADFSGGKVPDGYSLIPVNIREHLAYIVIPSDKVEKGMIEMAIFNFEGSEYAAVSCNGCSNGCALKTKNFGLVKYCDGCISGCTIHF